MPNFREIEEGRVGKRPFLQPKPCFGRYEKIIVLNLRPRDDKATMIVSKKKLLQCSAECSLLKKTVKSQEIINVFKV
jgi:hypothetical protein